MRASRIREAAVVGRLSRTHARQRGALRSSDWLAENGRTRAWSAACSYLGCRSGCGPARRSTVRGRTAQSRSSYRSHRRGLQAARTLARSPVHSTPMSGAVSRSPVTPKVTLPSAGKIVARSRPAARTGTRASPAYRPRAAAAAARVVTVFTARWHIYSGRRPVTRASPAQNLLSAVSRCAATT